MAIWDWKFKYKAKFLNLFQSPHSIMYTYERYNFRVITLLLGLLCFAFLMGAEYIGAVISLVLGVLVSFSYTGVSIDSARQQYIKYDRFLRFRIGRWESLPKPSYVTLVRISLNSQRDMAIPMVTPETKKGARAYKVNLVVDGDIRFIPICWGPLEKMKAEALKLGKELDLRVLDYTTHDKKWIL